MKCPSCGEIIPEGHMYCDKCGTEINFVPDFEPEVENEINATLSGVADELNKEEQLKKLKRIQERKRIKKLKQKILIAVLGTLGVIIVGVLVAFAISYSSKSPFYYMSNADSARANGDTDKAIAILVKGHEAHPNNSDIIFRLSDLYLEQGKEQEAVDTLREITDSGLFEDAKVLNAYESIISIYEQNGEYAKISELLSNGEGEVVSGLKDKYVPNSPMVTPGGGKFEDSVIVNLKLMDDSGNPIYYTVNDGDPDSSSILYSDEIVLDTEGEYNIKAVSINKYGIPSAIIENTYVIEKGAPEDPEIMEVSGDYNQNTMIVAVVQPGCTIFYTTDGSEPTMESNQYISPITMPVGTSHFRFIAYDNEGNCSNIVERDYHLIYTRLVSTEQAVNTLVNTLVRLDYLLDNKGKVRGQEGHNEYIYNSVIEIQGAGEYYVIVETHVNNDGSSKPTGLMYAVNTHDGTVNRLGYDSSGKYTLITISNR